MSEKCPICKNRKAAILENWIGLDRILFRQSRPNDVLNKTELKEYRNLKSMFLLNLFEIYSTTGHVIKNSHNSIKTLEEYSITKADLKFQESANMIKTESAEEALSEIIKEGMTELEISNIVLETVLTNAIDAFVFEGVELVGINNDDAGKLMIEAHRSCRNDLIKKVLNVKLK
jgi:hypothetical protein